MKRPTIKYNVEYTFAVICDTIKDFQHWKHNLGITDSVSDTNRSFIKNEIKYIAVVSEPRLQGIRIEGVIETQNCRFNKEYPKIMKMVQYSLH